MDEDAEYDEEIEHLDLQIVDLKEALRAFFVPGVYALVGHDVWCRAQELVK